MGTYQQIKNKVIDKTASVIATNFMGGRKNARIQKEAEADTKALKAYRAIKGKPIEPFNESNPDFRIRANAIQAEYNSKQRMKRMAK